jgi:predicted nucleotidyltransferase
MIKDKKLPSNIQELLQQVEAYLRSRPDILFAYIFGSLAKGKPHPLSDVDIAIYISGDKHFSEIKLDILGHLIDLLETDEIDLVVLNTASPILRMEVLESKRLIVDKEPFQRHKFESMTMRQYFDFSIKEMAILERRFLNGQ